jgi:hypothetical protein
MKPSSFEETYTLWLDGQLSPADAEAFEKQMRERGLDPVAERASGRKLHRLLHENSPAPMMKHTDFFNRQLMYRIEQEQREGTRPEAAQANFWRWLAFPKIAWAGIACLLIAGVMYKTMIPTTGPSPLEQSTYFATVVDSRTFDPTVSANTVYNPQDNLTVLWIDGLDYLPADYALQ